MRIYVTIFSLLCISRVSISQTGENCNSPIEITDTVVSLGEHDRDETWYRFRPKSKKVEIRVDADYVLFKSTPYSFCDMYSADQLRPARKMFNPDMPNEEGRFKLSKEELSGKCACYNCLKKWGYMILDPNIDYFLLVFGQPKQITLAYEYPEEQMVEAKKKTEIVRRKEGKSDVNKTQGPEIGTITIDQLDVGSTVKLNNIHFYGGSTKMLTSSFKELELLLKFMQKNATVKVEIQGHVNAPNRPERGSDQVLSDGRAEKVYKYLISKGVTKDRLTWKGYGAKRMLFPTAASQAHMQANRRVEVLILEK